MLLQKLLEKLMLENCIVKPMTVIVPRNVNCNKGLIAAQAKPVCIFYIVLEKLLLMNVRP